MSNDPHEDCNSGCHSDSCEHHGYLPVSGDMVSRADLDRAMAERFERLPTALNMIRQVIDAAPRAATEPTEHTYTDPALNEAHAFGFREGFRRGAAPRAATEPGLAAAARAYLDAERQSFEEALAALTDDFTEGRSRG